MSKVYFLTGCASGMARHMTSVLTGQGHKVFATDINLEALEATAKERAWPAAQVKLRRLDVTDPDDWEAAWAEAVEAFGAVDVLMNIAGLLLSSWVHESPLGETNGQIDVNLKGVVFGTQIAVRHMLPRGQGHVINIASIAGLAPVPGLSVYSATKHAVRAFSLSAALELRGKGVQVTAICPATVQTPMLDKQEEVGAAELFFSGMHILSVKDIEGAIMKALRRRPMEVHLPWLKLKMVQILGLYPWLGPLALPIYRWSGRRRQQQRQRQAK